MFTLQTRDSNERESQQAKQSERENLFFIFPADRSRSQADLFSTNSSNTKFDACAWAGLRCYVGFLKKWYKKYLFYMDLSSVFVFGFGKINGQRYEMSGRKKHHELESTNTAFAVNPFIFSRRETICDI